EIIPAALRVIRGDLPEDGTPVEPTGRISRVHIIFVATPKIVLRSRHDPGPDRVEVDIATQDPGVSLVFNQNGFESTLEQCARSAMPSVEQGCVPRGEIVHSAGKVRLWR